MTNFAPTRVFQMDRRSLFKWTGGAAGALVASPAALFAKGLCQEIELQNDDLEVGNAGAKVQYWIDGILFGSRSALGVRANLTLFLPLTQGPDSYVESVVLMNPEGKTLGARYFDASDKMFDNSYVPYVRFENLALDPAATYTIVYLVRTGSDSKLYSSELARPKLSALNNDYLPAIMRKDFKTFLAGGKTSPTPGLFSSPFQFYTKNGLEAHCARGRFQEIGSNGEFKIAVDFMHGDVDATHYMRYFIVMDPVGRILGLTKREAPDAAAEPVATVRKLDAAARQTFGVDALQIGDIRDCPYVQIFTEDSFDALARSILRFR